MSERRGLLPVVTNAAFELVQKAIDTNGKGYMIDLRTRMKEDNNYLSQAILMEGDVAAMDYNPETDANPSHLINSSYMIYGLLEAQATLDKKKLPVVTEDIDLLLYEIEDSQSLPIEIIRRLKEDNPLIIPTIEQRAMESKDAFKELYSMTRTYRLLECAAEYQSKGLVVKMPDQNIIN